MIRGIGRRAVAWLTRWGFATLVAIGTIAAAWVAATAAVPAEVPNFALRAAAIYRLEVGGAVFAGAYLTSLALVLALNNRAFTEIGATGLKAADLAGDIRSQNSREQAESIAGVLRQLEELETIARRPESR